MTLKEIIILTANYYDKKISPQLLDMYFLDLSDLPEPEVIQAYHDYRRNPKNKTMPLPAQIRDMIEPSIDPESAAREIAARINHAITKYGWSNETEASNYIGSEGWSIVERSGGWNYICQNHGITIDPGVFSAQIRELAKSQLTHDAHAMAKMIGIGEKRKSTDWLLQDSNSKKFLELLGAVKKID